MILKLVNCNNSNEVDSNNFIKQTDSNIEDGNIKNNENKDSEPQESENLKIDESVKNVELDDKNYKNDTNIDDESNTKIDDESNTKIDDESNTKIDDEKDAKTVHANDIKVDDENDANIIDENDVNIADENEVNFDEENDIDVEQNDKNISGENFKHDEENMQTENLLTLENKLQDEKDFKELMKIEGFEKKIVFTSHPISLDVNHSKIKMIDLRNKYLQYRDLPMCKDGFIPNSEIRKILNKPFDTPIPKKKNIKDEWNEDEAKKVLDEVLLKFLPEDLVEDSTEIDIKKVQERANLAVNKRNLGPTINLDEKDEINRELTDQLDLDDDIDGLVQNISMKTTKSKRKKYARQITKAAVMEQLEKKVKENEEKLKEKLRKEQEQEDLKAQTEIELQILKAEKDKSIDIDLIDKIEAKLKDDKIEELKKEQKRRKEEHELSKLTADGLINLLFNHFGKSETFKLLYQVMKNDDESIKKIDEILLTHLNRTAVMTSITNDNYSFYYIGENLDHNHDLIKITDAFQNSFKDKIDTNYIKSKIVDILGSDEKYKRFIRKLNATVDCIEIKLSHFISTDIGQFILSLIDGDQEARSILKHILGGNISVNNFIDLITKFKIDELETIDLETKKHDTIHVKSSETITDDFSDKLKENERTRESKKVAERIAKGIKTQFKSSHKLPKENRLKSSKIQSKHTDNVGKENLTIKEKLTKDHLKENETVSDKSLDLKKRTSVIYNVDDHLIEEAQISNEMSLDDSMIIKPVISQQSRDASINLPSSAKLKTVDLVKNFYNRLINEVWWPKGITVEINEDSIILMLIKILPLIIKISYHSDVTQLIIDFNKLFSTKKSTKAEVIEKCYQYLSKDSENVRFSKDQQSQSAHAYFSKRVLNLFKVLKAFDESIESLQEEFMSKYGKYFSKKRKISKMDRDSTKTSLITPENAYQMYLENETKVYMDKIKSTSDEVEYNLAVYGLKNILENQSDLKGYDETSILNDLSQHFIKLKNEIINSIDNEDSKHVEMKYEFLKRNIELLQIFTKDSKEIEEFPSLKEIKEDVLKYKDDYDDNKLKSTDGSFQQALKSLEKINSYEKKIISDSESHKQSIENNLKISATKIVKQEKKFPIELKVTEYENTLIDALSSHDTKSKDISKQEIQFGGIELKKVSSTESSKKKVTDQYKSQENFEKKSSKDKEINENTIGNLDSLVIEGIKQTKIKSLDQIEKEISNYEQKAKLKIESSSEILNTVFKEDKEVSTPIHIYETQKLAVEFIKKLNKLDNISSKVENKSKLTEFSNIISSPRTQPLFKEIIKKVKTSLKTESEIEVWETINDKMQIYESHREAKLSFTKEIGQTILENDVFVNNTKAIVEKLISDTVENIFQKITKNEEISEKSRDSAVKNLESLTTILRFLDNENRASNFVKEIILNTTEKVSDFKTTDKSEEKTVDMTENKMKQAKKKSDKDSLDGIKNEYFSDQMISENDDSYNDFKKSRQFKLLDMRMRKSQHSKLLKPEMEKLQETRDRIRKSLIQFNIKVQSDIEDVEKVIDDLLNEREKSTKNPDNIIKLSQALYSIVQGLDEGEKIELMEIIAGSTFNDLIKDMQSLLTQSVKQFDIPPTLIRCTTNILLLQNLGVLDLDDFEMELLKFKNKYPNEVSFTKNPLTLGLLDGGKKLNMSKYDLSIDPKLTFLRDVSSLRPIDKKKAIELGLISHVSEEFNEDEANTFLSLYESEEANEFELPVFIKLSDTDQDKMINDYKNNNELKKNLFEIENLLTNIKPDFENREEVEKLNSLLKISREEGPGTKTKLLKLIKHNKTMKTLVNVGGLLNLKPTIEPQKTNYEVNKRIPRKLAPLKINNEIEDEVAYKIPSIYSHLAKIKFEDIDGRKSYLNPRGTAIDSLRIRLKNEIYKEYPYLNKIIDLDNFMNKDNDKKFKNHLNQTNLFRRKYGRHTTFLPFIGKSNSLVSSLLDQGLRILHFNMGPGTLIKAILKSQKRSSKKRTDVEDTFHKFITNDQLLRTHMLPRPSLISIEDWAKVSAPGTRNNLKPRLFNSMHGSTHCDYHVLTSKKLHRHGISVAKHLERYELMEIINKSIQENAYTKVQNILLKCLIRVLEEKT